MSQTLTFIDVFAGCGGLSLGLLQAGLKGRFAIEHNTEAFQTLSHNLVKRGVNPRFSWPQWFPQKPISIEAFLEEYDYELESLSGNIDILAGGPPCQGFSIAGRRQHDDPRNKLFKSYVSLVEKVQPKVVLIENVKGFTMDFGAPNTIENYAEKLNGLLSKNYQVFESLVDLSNFGVPQTRIRYFLLAFSPEIQLSENPFDLLSEKMPAFLRSVGLKAPISSLSAISDLEVNRCGTRQSSEFQGFEEIEYRKPLTSYQKLMNKGVKNVSDTRLAKHREDIKKRFQEIIDLMHAEGRSNKSLSEEVRTAYGLKKQALRVLDPDTPAPTITSMPDDLLHYAEPRALTVRENARLQSFPDWFEFQGKYTTGGKRRRFEVPRFTQVANAVPPLAAEALGHLLISILEDSAKNSEKSSTVSRNLFMKSTELAA